MISDLKPYPEYKDSGSRWIGDIPSHWEVHNFRTLITKRAERNRPDLPLLSVAREKGVFVRSLTDENENHNVIPEDLTNYKVARAGNLVINKMKAWQGSMGIAPCDGIVSPAYFVFEFRIHNHGFGQALLRSKPYVAHFGQASDGVRVGQWDLSIPGMRQIPILVAGDDEQDAIERFLNHAHGRVEWAIRAKRKVIALLNEQKQAIIHRAVTRGLNPSIPLKPSGIPWLGDIPKNWEVRRLRTLVHRIDQGVSPLAVGFLADGDSWGVLKSGCVNRGIFRETEHKQLARGFEIDPAIVLNVGDVLISRACGSPSLVGSVGRVRSLRYKLILSDKTFRAHFRESVDVDFMVFAMNGRYYRHQVEQAISGAEGMANNLPLSSLRDFNFAIPPKHEATAIAGYLESETAGLHTTISRLEREVDLLREYRARLVADVVTGKFDVREAAAHLPEEATPESDATDDTDIYDEAEIADEEAVA
jgi:type I restriction enzyme S subunit